MTTATKALVFFAATYCTLCHCDTTKEFTTVKESRELLKEVLKNQSTGEKTLEAQIINKKWSKNNLLESAELAIAIASYLHYNNTSETTKNLLKQRIEKHFINRITENSYNRDTNWHQVIQSAKLIYGVTFQNKTTQASALEELNNISNLFSDDSIYKEGFCYWNYAVSYQLYSYYLYEKQTGLAASIPNEIIESANQYLNAQDNIGRIYNYNDCNLTFNSSFAMSYLTEKKITKLDTATQLTIENKKKIFNTLDANIFLPLIASKGQQKQHFHPPKTYATTTSEYFIYKNENHYLAINLSSKIGSHSHIDGGSLIYNKNSIRWLDELPHLNYELAIKQEYDLWNLSDSSSRWKSTPLSNKGHNTITFNDELHKFNNLNIINQTHTETRMDIALDTSSLSDWLNSGSRTISLTDRLLINDSFITVKNLKIEINYYFSPSVDFKKAKNGYIIIKDRNQLNIKIEPTNLRSMTHKVRDIHGRKNLKIEIRTKKEQEANLSVTFY